MNESGRNSLVEVAALRASRVDGAGERSDRLVLCLGLLTEAVRGRPELEEMGARMWVMLHRLCPGLLWELRGPALRLVRSIPRRGWTPDVPGLDAETEDMLRVGEIIKGDSRDLRGLGRRVSLLAYALVRGQPEVSEALCSLESIGHLWGLRAKNKRAAPSAAVMKIQAELDKAELRTRREAKNVLWFQKRRETRAAYAEVQRGNTHRAEGVRVEDEDEAEREAAAGLREVIEGVPVKAEYRGLTAAQVRARLDALWRESERRRLEAI